MVAKICKVDPAELAIKVTKRGCPPEGGGEITFSCPIVKVIDPFSLVNEGRVKKIRGVVFTAKVTPKGVESPTFGFIKSGPKNYQKTSTIAFLSCFA